MGGHQRSAANVSRETRPQVGIAGTGFVARHFAMELARRPDWRLGPVLTRRPLDRVEGFPGDHLTDSLDALIDGAEIILECTGDVPQATRVVGRALAAGRPVLTLDPEFHVTTGSCFVGQGYLSEADGDQPGCQASLHEEAVAMGFEPLVLGNLKGFLNRTPSLEDMSYWGQKQGISLPMVTSFTDGTKLQVEQCLVGNFLGADILEPELVGPAIDDLGEAGALLGERAARHGRPVVDYVLSRRLPHGVFLVARHDPRQAAALGYLKLGDGPFYTILRPNIFVHLEVFKTLERWRRGLPPLLHNGARPHLSVAAVAKRRLSRGEFVARGCGSFELRGICVRIADEPEHLPIGLAERIRLRHDIEPGQILTLTDVEPEDGALLALWQGLMARCARTGAQ
jgi:predicted homoserine dehydrogenase-like protein